MQNADQNVDKDKLKDFQKKMQEEGAAGFADGPCPWDAWDESGAQAGKRVVWEGKARHIYRKRRRPAPRSLGDRVLSGLAMIALATMAVGIAGVYFSKEKPPTVAWTAVQPTPIPLTSQARMPAPLVAQIESLPPTAAGSTAISVVPAPAGAAADRMPAQAVSVIGKDGNAEPQRDTTTTPAEAPVATPEPVAETRVEIAQNDPDVTIIRAPSALLLTSTPTPPEKASDIEAAAEIDPDLAMEIATAPAVTTTMDEETGASQRDSWENTSGNSFEAGREGTSEAAIAQAQGAAAGESQAAATAVAGAAAPVDGTPVPRPDSAAADDTAAESTAAAANLEALPPSAAGHVVASSGTITRELEVAQPKAAQDSAAPEQAQTAAQPEAAQASAAPEEVQTAVQSEAEQTSTVPEEAQTAVPSEAEQASTVPEEAQSAAQPEVMRTSAAPEEAQTVAQTGESTAETSPAAAESSEADGQTLAAVEPALAATTAPPAAAPPQGDWVVNLASYTYEAMAKRKLALFENKGVAAEIQTVTVNDKPMYRIRVTGFESSAAARNSIPKLEQTLGLKGVWIARR